MTRRTFLFVTAALGYVLALTMAVTAAAPGAASSPPSTPAAAHLSTNARGALSNVEGQAPPAAAGYVGEETCL